MLQYLNIVYRFFAEIVFGYKIQETKTGLFKNRIIKCSLNIYIYSSHGVYWDRSYSFPGVTPLLSKNTDYTKIVASLNLPLGWEVKD